MSMKYVSFTAPLQSKQGDEKVSIKGFASVSQLDRENEIVPDPREFDVKTFMSAPTLLMNHKFVLDEFGNQSAAGIVTKSIPSYVKAISDNIIEVASLDGNEVVGQLDQRISPTLKVGDLGLFVEAQVTHPVAIQKVLSGELTGLSWQGFSKKTKTICDTGEICNQLRKIDLVEISIVHHPAQRQSTFMIAKSSGGEVELSPSDLNRIHFYGIRFQKLLYPSVSTVKEYLSARELDASSIEEDELSYLALTSPKERFECSKSISIAMGGVDFISAPEKDQDQELLIAAHVGQLNTTPVLEKTQMANSQKKLRLFLLNEQGLLSRFPSLKSQMVKSCATLDGEEVEVLTLEFPESQETDPIVEDVTTETVAVERVQVVENPDQLAKLSKEIEELRALVSAKSTVETPATPVVEAVAETVVEIPVEAPALVSEIQKQLANYNEMFAQYQTENDKLKAMLADLVSKGNQETPAHGARAETLVEKNLTQPSDPVSVVGSWVSRAFNQTSR